jgi:hypothetical protein
MFSACAGVSSIASYKSAKRFLLPGRLWKRARILKRAASELDGLGINH